jgi:acetyl esterase
VELDRDLAVMLERMQSEARPRQRALPLSESRIAYDEACSVLDPSPPGDVEVEELTVAGAAGGLAAWLLRPQGAGDGLVVWLHGGGWLQGSLRSHEAALRRLAQACSQAVLAIEYRLAPEHPFPAGLDDAEAALRWALSNAGELGADASRVALGGDSAGATLALVASLECARDVSGAALAVLCYPSLGPELMSESHHDFDHDFGLTADDMAFFYEQYLPAGQSHADPRVSPLLTPDLHHAPPSIVAVAGFDPLRDEGLALAGLLEGSGVEVTLLDEPSMIHGYLRMGGNAAARSAIERLGAAVAERLSG